MAEHDPNVFTHRRWYTATVVVLVLCTACHHSAARAIKTSAAAVGGTIAGIVEVAGGTAVLNGRTVTAVDVTTGERYETTTGMNGGYTIDVPKGTYRLEVELREGETLDEEPTVTRVSNGAPRDFDVTSQAGRE